MKRTRPFVNWGANHRAYPCGYLRPRDVGELRAMVARLRARGDVLRIVGAGHSWSDIACTHGYMLSLEHLDRVVSVDCERHRMTVQAGIRLHALNRALADAGLALSNLGDVAAPQHADELAFAVFLPGVEQPGENRDECQPARRGHGSVLAALTPTSAERQA